MSIRKILPYGTNSLREKSKEVSKFSKKIQSLITDLLETMYTNNGVGLAAPQIGENLRIFVIDVSTNDEPLNPIVFINPKIIKKEGAIACQEGCLSFPKVYTEVKRYQNVVVKALDRKGKPFVIEAKDGSLLARAIQHENDHLDGILFIDHVTNRFAADEELLKFDLPPIDADKLLEEKELDEILANQPKVEPSENDIEEDTKND